MGRHASLSTRRVQTGTLYFVALLREELGRRIAAARTSAGLSQQQLAAEIGLKHAQDVSRYERGKVEVPSHRIDLIAEATGRPRSYFVRDPSEPDLSSTPSDGDGLQEALQDVREQVQAVLAEVQAMRADVDTRLAALEAPRRAATAAARSRRA